LDIRASPECNINGQRPAFVPLDCEAASKSPRSYSSNKSLLTGARQGGPTHASAGTIFTSWISREATLSGLAAPPKEPQYLDAIAQLAPILNEVVALPLRVDPLNRHRFPANDASHEIKQWAPVIIH
jgi:hypothetical protein